MPVKIKINKTAGEGPERCFLSPSPANILTSRDADPDGRVRVEISAAAELTAPVSLSLPPNARSMFDSPPQDMTLSPGGAPLTLVFKNSLGIVRRPAGSKHFGDNQPTFSKQAGIDISSPPRSDHNGHADWHIEC